MSGIYTKLGIMDIVSDRPYPCGPRRTSPPWFRPGWDRIGMTRLAPVTLGVTLPREMGMIEMPLDGDFCQGGDCPGSCVTS
jgi:hypothetical protein